ncbi:acyl-coenzyme A oxidase 1-like [Lycorma delicatula]|uniref:acyl-coenzyme A oxidase 1-like n=1 Tax=Lycorma delicatula TaxID=130591 RepID=UPI003F513FF4
MFSRKIKVKKINEDLDKERKKCTFNTLELTNLLDGGPEKTKERIELEEFFLNDPELQDKVPIEYVSHAEKYQESVRKSCIMFKKIKEWQDKKNVGSGVDIYQSILGGMLGSAILKDGMPFALHYVMFIPALMGQGTMQQQAYWIGRAWNCEIICTYAQTELGHGTFIRGLETTATYDPSKEEFVLNSPTLTSYKWWPGGLGQTANYALVMAQLYINNACYGIHPFVVQLRDEETHMPMPGIKIGEIGSKLGMNGTNNGYLGFENVRIPRDQMLMKNAKVLKDGTYLKSPSDKLAYGTMIFVRVAIVRGVAASYLAKAVTIATRYSAVRRQSELKQGEREPQILDYHTQQYKLLPNIATSLAMTFSSTWLWNMYNNVTHELEEGNMERLPELHAIACCLKAVCTADAAAAIEECRRACGGHGYMSSSNFPASYGMVTAAETYEGENTVLYLQTARYLVKCWQQSKGPDDLPLTVKYLKSAASSYSLYSWENALPCLLQAYQQVSAGLIKTACDKIDRLVNTGMSPEDAWNNTSIQLVQSAEAHCRAFKVLTFIEYVREGKLSQPLRIVLTQLCELYAVYWLLKKLGHFLMYSSLRKEDVGSLYNWQDSLLSALRPNAVGIVDSFDICDEILGSVLGAYDGNVYERLFEAANESPLNKKPVDDSFQKYLKPFLKSNL